MGQIHNAISSEEKTLIINYANLLSKLTEYQLLKVPKLYCHIRETTEIAAQK